MEAFAPGDLVHARGREWVAMPSADPDVLCLRPLSGTEADLQFLHPALERAPVRHARFEMPDLEQTGTRDAASLLSQALRLSLRRGAGPFRSAGRVAFEPRAYQLVPLLMALRLPVVRLLIGDDVGIGKTIEAGLNPSRTDRPRRGRPLLGPLSAASGGPVDGRAEGEIRSRRRGGHGDVGAAAGAWASPVADLVRHAPLHRGQPRLHQGRSAPRRVCACLPRPRGGRRGACLRRHP